MKLAPSSAGIWGSSNGCPAYAQLSSKFPELSKSDASAIGTSAHWVGERLLLAHTSGGPEEFLGPFLDYRTLSPDAVRKLIGGVCPETNLTITDEMVHGANVYVDYIMGNFTNSFCAGVTMCLEGRLVCPSIHKLNYGTVDFASYNPSTQTLDVVDYKNGRRPVEAFENKQMTNYAIAFLDSNPHISSVKIKTIRLTIVQPNAYHEAGIIRTWGISFDRLLEEADKLKAAAELALSPNPPAKTGDHCRYCTARAHCATLQNAAYASIEFTQQGETASMPDESLGLELKMLEDAEKLIQYRRSGIEEVVLSKISSGAGIPGYSIGFGRGKTVWKMDDDKVVGFGKMLGVNLEKPNVPITPTQAEKIVPKNLIGQLVNKLSGKKKLIHSKTDARSIFGG